MKLGTEEFREFLVSARELLEWRSKNETLLRGVNLFVSALATFIVRFE